MNIFDYFKSKEEQKEVIKEIIKSNGDKVSQTIKTTTIEYTIPNDIKEILKQEIQSNSKKENK